MSQECNEVGLLLIHQGLEKTETRQAAWHVPPWRISFRT